MISLSPSLFVACAAGRLSGRSTFACTCDRNHRYEAITASVREDEEASLNFVWSAGYWSHYEHATGESSWPLPPVDRVNELVSFARNARVLFQRPDVGDVVAVWNTEQSRYTRVSIVAVVLGEGTIERNGEVLETVKCLTLGTHRAGPRARPERFAPSKGDRFLRWANLEWRSRSGVPLERAA